MYKCKYCNEEVMRVYRGYCMNCAKCVPEFDKLLVSYMFIHSKLNVSDNVVEIKRYLPEHKKYLKC